MARINLRPWREELRAERQQQFIVMLVGAFVIAGGLVFLWNQSMTSAIEYQNSRNSYLTKEMATLDEKIKEIETLKEKREALLSRMKVIQDLQGKRPVIVRIFDELVRTIPEGVYYEKVKRSGGQLSITGYAESNNRISTLMRKFEESVWFADPNLAEVSAAQKAGLSSRFILTVTEQTPQAQEGAK